ncbi:MAG: MBOAT family protein, partial [Eggerthellaceae bacterium]|nr:MBOAT family protein [Eggerthellaceae bacterium]
FKGKNALLIVASLFFSAYGEPVYIVLMVVSTLFNWLFGLLIGKSGTPSSRKLWVAAAVVVNLAFLGTFKYAGMAIGTFDALTGLGLPDPGIALPIGISFYTFQAMSYVIDVYRGDVQAQRSYPKVLLYIAFFPQLIAGPIVKYHDVEAQLSERHASLADIAAGFRRFCIGLGKKVLIANTMAVAVDSIYAAQLDHVNIAVAWIAALAYLMQIYFDFSGYSDMAIGMARMFGFVYQENFKYPYTSPTVQVFWRRWHISLSTWFKQYVYFPLGGNRKGRARTVFNKLAIFFLCGLWHGASWTFVVWGLIHGFFLLLEEYLPIRKLPKPIGIVYTLLVVTVAFVLFRADSFTQGGYIIAQMFTGWHFEYACVELATRQLTPLFIATFMVAIVASTPIKGALERKVAETSDSKALAFEVASYVLAFALLVLSLLALSGGGYNPFIYFRF